MITEAARPKNMEEFQRIKEGDAIFITPIGLDARVAVYSGLRSSGGSKRHVFSGQIKFSNSVVQYAKGQKRIEFDEKDGGILLGATPTWVLDENDGRQYTREVGKLTKAGIWFPYRGVQR